MVWSILFACGPQLSATPELVVPEDLPTPPASLVGLTPDDGELHLVDLGRTSGVDSGVELSNDGLWAHAGMKGYTCDLWTQDGSLAADLNYPGTGDEVIDGDDNRLLVRTEDGLFATRFGQHTASGQLNEEFLADARIVDGGLVTLAEEPDGCRVAWYTDVDAPDASTFVEDSWCGGGVVMLAERDSGTVWLLDDDALVQVDRDGTYTYDLGGDHMTWDPAWDQVYVARDGERGVQAVEVGGGWRSVETSGPVQGLGSLGQVGALIVASPGAIEVLWGEDGQVWGSYQGMVQLDGAVKTSQTGAVLAAVDGTQARFFLGEVF